MITLIYLIDFLKIEYQLQLEADSKAATNQVDLSEVMSGDTCSIMSLRFNQDGGCFVCATSNGFLIFNTDPLREKQRIFWKDGGVGCAEMLFRCSHLALGKKNEEVVKKEKPPKFGNMPALNIFLRARN